MAYIVVNTTRKITPRTVAEKIGHAAHVDGIVIPAGPVAPRKVDRNWAHFPTLSKNVFKMEAKGTIKIYKEEEFKFAEHIKVEQPGKKISFAETPEQQIQKVSAAADDISKDRVEPEYKIPKVKPSKPAEMPLVEPVVEDNWDAGNTETIIEKPKKKRARKSKKVEVIEDGNNN
jgi:hypothetical protein